MPLLVAALAVCVLPGVADAKKKRDKIGVATYNLYLGSDLDDATQAGVNGRTDLFADEVGFVLKDVDANNFNTRAKHIADDLKRRKVDLVGLQEAALWRVQIPTDGTPIGPGNVRAGLVTYDYVQTLLEELNKKAKSKKQCAKRRAQAKASPNKKDDKKAKNCYRGYKLVIDQQEADLEFFGDFDNDPGPDGKTFDVSNSASLGAAAPSRWLEGNDDSGISFGEPPSGPGQLPQDANFDSHAFSESPNPPIDPGTGAGTDPDGVTDCPDNKAGAGPALGAGGGLFPFSGYDSSRVDVCMFHGIDGDASLTMRDAIIARKGFGVKTKNSSAGNYSNKFAVDVFGGAASVDFLRGWTATNAKIRGKKFRFVNTHLESISAGSIREDQASELFAPGGPADHPKVVLVGDLNSDPNRAPVNLPNGDGGSNIAINRLFTAGFEMLTPLDLATGSHGDHGDVINDPNDLLGEGFIDHILTNKPSAIERKGKVRILDGFEDGLWQSDHAGVYVPIKGKKRKK